MLKNARTKFQDYTQNHFESITILTIWTSTPSASNFVRWGGKRIAILQVTFIHFPSIIHWVIREFKSNTTEHRQKKPRAYLPCKLMHERQKLAAVTVSHRLFGKWQATYEAKVRLFSCQRLHKRFQSPACLTIPSETMMLGPPHHVPTINFADPRSHQNDSTPTHHLLQQQFNIISSSCTNRRKNSWDISTRLSIKIR